MRSRRIVASLASAGVVFLLAMATAAAGAPPKLRYGVKAGQQYTYDVKIEAELEDYNESREGALTFTISSADENQFALRCAGSLATRQKPKPGSNTMFLPGPSFGVPRFGGVEEFTLNRQGEVIVSRSGNSLPYLLGYQEVLVFEPLPADGRTNWENQQDLVILEGQSSGPFPRFGFHSDENATKRTAKERTTYSVLETKPDAVRISKRYDLRTAEMAGGGPRLEMTGSGEFLFDLKEGTIRTLTMKYNIVSRDGNHVEQFPVSVTYQMPTPEELAERKKKADEAKAAAEEAARPKPFAPGERVQLLADLRSRDSQKQKEAAERLAKTPVDDQSADVAKALAALLASSNSWVRQSAAAALVIWVTPDVEAELCRAVTENNPFVRGPAMLALAKIPSARAAEAVAAQMFGDRHAAATALKAMGPVAEQATIGCLKDRDVWVRRDVCAVLGEIGGQAALAALQQHLLGLTGHADYFEKKSTEDALDAIRARLASAPASVPAASQAAAATPAPAESTAPPAASSSGLPGFRTWHDASGLFEIDAVMIAHQDGKVTLVKKDGKTIAVPLEKLSAADREYVQKYAK